MADAAEHRPDDPPTSHESHTAVTARSTSTTTDSGPHR